LLTKIETGTPSTFIAKISKYGRNGTFIEDCGSTASINTKFMVPASVVKENGVPILAVLRGSNDLIIG